MYRSTSVVVLTVVFLFMILVNADAELYKRAPDILPGTIPEMRDPAYWIRQMDNPDEVILTLPEITSRNEAYLKKMSRPDPFAGVHPGRVPMDWQLNRWPARFLVRPDLEAMSTVDLTSLVRQKIQECIDFIQAETYGNYLGVAYSDHEIDGIIDEATLESEDAVITIREGIPIRTTLLRVVPARFPSVVGIKNIDTTNYTVDLWTSALVRIGTPITVLHRSRSGSHLFVMGDNQFGWVPAEDIAFGDEKAIRLFSGPDDFLVCTGNWVPYYGDERCQYVSGWFRMGDRICLEPGSTHQKIWIPSRAVNGELRMESAWLAPDADVHKGYVPYTRRNIVTLAFKLLDDPYDWTGATLGRNHETTYQDIFTCFGFKLPHNGGLYTHYGNNDIAALPDMGKEKQYELVLANEPFVSFTVSRGHVSLLLGEYNNEPILFDQNGYSYTDETGETSQVKRCSIITPLVVSYFLKYPITFLELK